jgi:hypothetical protein
VSERDDAVVLAYDTIRRYGDAYHRWGRVVGLLARRIGLDAAFASQEAKAEEGRLVEALYDVLKLAVASADAGEHDPRLYRRIAEIAMRWEAAPE